MNHSPETGVIILFLMGCGGIALFVTWIVSLIDVLKNEFKGSNKIIWLILLLAMAPLGTILYQIIGKKQKV
jgi:hypothetical protein